MPKSKTKQVSATTMAKSSSPAPAKAAKSNRNNGGKSSSKPSSVLQLPKRRELVATVLAGTSGAIRYGKKFLNPGYVGFFPWLAGIANSYERYRFKYLAFHYIPEASNVSTSAALGTVGMALVLDANSSDFASIEEFDAYHQGRVAKPTESMTIVVDLNRLMYQGPRYNTPQVDPSGLSAHADANMYYLGSLQWALVGSPATADQRLGRIEVEYIVEFDIPKQTTLGFPINGYASPATNILIQGQMEPVTTGLSYPTCHYNGVGSCLVQYDLPPGVRIDYAARGTSGFLAPFVTLANRLYRDSVWLVKEAVSSAADAMTLVLPTYNPSAISAAASPEPLTAPVNGNANSFLNYSGACYNLLSENGDSYPTSNSYYFQFDGSLSNDYQVAPACWTTLALPNRRSSFFHLICLYNPNVGNLDPVEPRFIPSGGLSSKVDPPRLQVGEGVSLAKPPLTRQVADGVANVSITEDYVPIRGMSSSSCASSSSSSETSQPLSKPSPAAFRLPSGGKREL